MVQISIKKKKKLLKDIWGRLICSWFSHNSVISPQTGSDVNRDKRSLFFNFYILHLLNSVLVDLFAQLRHSYQANKCYCFLHIYFNYLINIKTESDTAITSSIPLFFNFIKWRKSCKSDIKKILCPRDLLMSVKVYSSIPHSAQTL